MVESSTSQGKLELQLWQGKDLESAKLLGKGEVASVIDMDILLFDGKPYLLAVVRDRHEWDVAAIFESEDDQKKTEWVFKTIVDPQDLLIPDGTEHAVFYNSASKSDQTSGRLNIAVSVFGFSNFGKSQVFNSNFEIIRHQAGFNISPIINRDYFTSEIKLLSVSFSPRESPSSGLTQAIGDFTNSAYLVVMMDNSRIFTLIGYPFMKQKAIPLKFNAREEFMLDQGEEKFFTTFDSAFSCDEEATDSKTDTSKTTLECAIVTSKSQSLII